MGLNKAIRISFAVASFLICVVFSNAATFSKPLTLDPIETFNKGDVVDLPVLKTLDGKDFSLDSFRGDKIVIAAFWLQTCDLCIEHFGTLHEFMKNKKRAKNVEVVTFIRAEDDVERDYIDSVVKRNKIPFTVVLDPKLEVARHFSLNQIPAYVVIGRDGRLAVPKVHHPSKKIRDYSLLDFVDRMIEGNPVDRFQLIPYTQDANLRVLIGEEAPDFTLSDIEGKEYTLSEYRGQMNVLLAFWHPYCTFCVVEMKQLADYFQENRMNYNFMLLSVASLYGPSQLDEAKKFSKEIDGVYPIIDDELNEVGKRFHVEKNPTFFFINKDGIIVDAFQGDTKSAKNRYSPVFEEMMTKD